MHKEHLHTHASINRYDPTRTTVLRNAFTKDMNNRFNALSNIIYKTIVTEDAFGLNNKITIHGGPGSGNFGHSGRPGEVGGSGDGGGSSDSGSSTQITSEEHIKISEAVAIYQSTLFDAINNELRYDKPDKFKDTISLLDKGAIDTTNDVLYRGLDANYTKEIANKYNVKDISNIKELKSKLIGKSLTDKAFMSTTRELKVAGDFARDKGNGKTTVIQIEGKKIGIEVLKHVDTFRAKQEKEFLIKRNTTLLIKNVSLSKTGKLILYTKIKSTKSKLTINAEFNTPQRASFAFPRSADKVEKFRLWLDKQIKNGILEVGELNQLGTGINGAWTNKYIFDSYKRGVIRARYELKKAGYDVPTIEATGGIAMSMSTPLHLDRVGLLYTRAFSELKSVTSQMDTQISRVLSQGIADGDNPKLLARKMRAVITGSGSGDLAITDSIGRFIPAKRRAEMIARTEIIRAHHQATIQEYRNWAAEGVRVRGEWKTAGFGVCPECAELEGHIFDLDKIESMIPLHPNCRCVALPVIVEKDDKYKRKF